MTILVDTILSFIFVGSSTIHTITPEIARRINATGVPGYKQHTFEHTFFLMALEFIAQAVCFLIWYIITGGYTPPRNPHLHAGWDRAAMGVGGANADEEQAPDGQDDEPLLDANHHVIQAQDGAGGGQEDDDPLLNPDEDEEIPENHIPLPVQPNNPAWNQRPVDQTKFNPFLFVVPTAFDLSRYGLMYIAIKLTYNSCFILIRGASVLFTVLLRVAFLSKHMAKYMIVSIGMVIVGLGLIGMTDFIYRTPSGYDQYGLAAGCLLMMMSQILIAMQIVYEEKFMDKHSIHPLRVVGLEGLFGSLVALVAVLIFSFFPSGPFSVLKDFRLEDVRDAMLQMRSSWILALCVAGRVISKPLMYYTGTRFVRNQHDAAKRITIDVHHDLIIWSISLGVGWQHYFYPQIFGYILIPVGMMVYCDVIPLPAIFRPPAVPPPAGPLQEHEQQALLDFPRIRDENRNNVEEDANNEADADGGGIEEPANQEHH